MTTSARPDAACSSIGSEPGRFERSRSTTSPASVLIRPATLADLPPLTELYNYYVVNTPITFDLQPLTVEQRRQWFQEHADEGRHRLLVADEGEGQVVGYATTSRFRTKAAYDTTVESSVYCRFDRVGRGIGTALYQALFEALKGEDINRIVAGVTLPNPASIALHERCGFRQVGALSSVGRKFDRYWDVAWFERALVL
jgi:phosphinothricin acetyltransferase